MISPFGRKSSCGHSCLRYAIVFYCTLMVISCICIICYSSRFFGLVTTLMTDEDIPLLNPRLEVYAIILSSIIMLIFFVGLIGSLLESALCLRIFGGIVSYLFLLTFGACLYSVILLMLTNAHIRLLFSIGSFSAALIVCHASIAIAPFVLADDISKVFKSLTRVTHKHVLINYSKGRHGQSYRGVFSRGWNILFPILESDPQGI